MKLLVRCAIGLGLAATLLTGELAWAHDSGFGLARYTPAGVLDQTFGRAGLVVTRSAIRGFVANALALQPDGRILVGGMASDLGRASLQLAVARYLADGRSDETFGLGGVAAIDAGVGGAEASSLVLQPDGRIVVAGTAFGHGTERDGFAVARLAPDGTPDATFGRGGLVTTAIGAAAASAQAVVLQPDGRIVVVGTVFASAPTEDDFVVARYLSDGGLDPTFGQGGIVTTDFGSGQSGAPPSLDRTGGVALLPDGRIVVGGTSRGERQAFAVARYTSAGGLDPDFGVSGKALVEAAEPQVYAVIVQPSGDVVVAGSAGSLKAFAMVRLSADGRADEAFGSAGVVTTPVEGSRSGARAVATQADGKLLIGGAEFGAPSAQGDALPQSGFAVARYNADGTIDSSFGSDGSVKTEIGDAGATPLSLVVQSDGRIVAAGLVFFRVPTADSSMDVALRLAAPAAGLVVVAAGVGLSVLYGVRRRQH